MYIDSTCCNPQQARDTEFGQCKKSGEVPGGVSSFCSGERKRGIEREEKRRVGG